VIRREPRNPYNYSLSNATVDASTEDLAWLKCQRYFVVLPTLSIANIRLLPIDHSPCCSICIAAVTPSPDAARPPPWCEVYHTQ